MTIIEKISQDMKTVFKKMGLETSLAFVTFSDRPELCDFQCNASFLLSKTLHKAPLQIAEDIKKEIEGQFNKYLVEVCKPGFINLTLKNEYLLQITNELLGDERCGIEKMSNKKLIVDYGGANVAKPLHVGHLRSAVIGQALCNLASFMGDTVIGDAHLGDWGLQMGLTIAGLMDKYSVDEQALSMFGQDKFSLDVLNEVYPASSKKSKTDEDFKNKAKTITTKLQNKEEPYFSIWKKLRGESVRGIDKDYGNLGVHFDLFWGESDAESHTDKLFEMLEEKKLWRESEGAMVVDVANDEDTEPMPPLIAKAGHGAELYGTTDLATILKRKQMFDPNEIWYITDNRQSLHFKQVFRVSEKLGLTEDGMKLGHYPFGTVNGIDGKPFKTRDGGTMKLGDLVDMIQSSAKEKLKENNVEDEDGLSLKIGVSALKFGDMSNFRERDYVFDIDKFSSFEGKTGPYILYTMVRIKSILNKINNDFSKGFSGEFSAEEKNIIINILKLNTSFISAYSLKAPNLLCQALYDVAASFSTFYNNIKILSENNLEIKNRYLSLIYLILKNMQITTDVLGIIIPEKM